MKYGELIGRQAMADVPDTNVGDTVYRQAAIDVLDVLCQEHRYKIPGKRETYSQYNEAWQDALDRAEGAIFNLPSAQPDCSDCIKHGGDWDCDHVHCHKGKQPDNDMIHLQKEQAYLQGWEEGRKALREETRIEI